LFVDGAFGRELLLHARYAPLSAWRGRETTDLVYTDRDGNLMLYLREQCIGSMPDSIPQNRDFARQLLKQFLEVHIYD
jgi:hypothetical protein